MSNYYDKRDAKVNIAHALMDLGWKVLGYKPNQSDLMTDYYSPANWDGIATKNGFTLVVDNKYASEGREIKKYNPKGNLSYEDQQKINKLSQMTVDNGATEGEEQNAKILIAKLQSKISGESQYIVTGKIPGYMANPGRSIWHIEKDGVIYDKGSALTKYSRIPESYEFDLVKMEFKKGHDTWMGGEKKTITEEQRKIINQFKQLLLRFERVVNGMNSCGDGTKETEQAGLEQQQNAGMEKVIKNVVKKVIKPVEKDNSIINKGDVLSFSYYGHYWLVIDVYKDTKGNNNVVYELLGSASRGYQRLKNGKRYYQPETRLQKEMSEGKVKVYTLQEVEEVTEVEKWVKVKETKKTNNKKQTSTKEPKETKTNKAEPSNNNNTTDNTESATSRQLWALHIASKRTVNTRSLNISKQQASELIGRSKKGEDITEELKVLAGIKVEQEQPKEPEQTNTFDPEKIEECYIYNCHFKEWKFNIQQLQDIATQYNLPWFDLDNKIGFTCLTAEQTTLAKTISDSNESMFFIDAKIKITDIEQTEQETEQAAETLIDFSTSILTELNITLTEIDFEQELKQQYIKKLSEHVNQYNIPITINMIKYLMTEGYDKLVGVLALVSISTNNTTEQKTPEPEQQPEDQSNYIERLEKTIVNNNKKIETLSGDYLTNTPKRAREQASRDNQKEKLQQDNLIFEYLKEKAEDNNLTELEKSLTVNTFRQDIRYYYLQNYYYKNEVNYPEVNNSYPADGWWNLEVPKRQKRLNKGNIFNTQDLLKAIEEYKNIITTLKKPKDPITEQIKKKEQELKFCNIPGYFPTPKNIVNKMIELAELKEGETILEPSAGNASIADSIKAEGFKCDCIEWNYSLRELLKLKGYNVITDDFLTYSNYGKYDKVLMNPPFEKLQDIKHVKHAYKMLKNNGRIVAIMSPHFTFANDKESIDFREWLFNKGYYEKLPEGSFKDSGTNINTVIVIIDKKENDMSQAG